MYILTQVLDGFEVSKYLDVIIAACTMHVSI